MIIIIGKLNVAVLLDRLDSRGSENFKVDTETRFNDEWDVLMKAKEEYYKSAGQVLLKDL